jgi:hypothetical protein
MRYRFDRKKFWLSHACYALFTACCLWYFFYNQTVEWTDEQTKFAGTVLVYGVWVLPVLLFASVLHTLALPAEYRIDFVRRALFAGEQLLLNDIARLTVDIYPRFSCYRIDVENRLGMTQTMNYLYSSERLDPDFAALRQCCENAGITFVLLRRNQN